MQNILITKHHLINEFWFKEINSSYALQHEYIR